MEDATPSTAVTLPETTYRGSLTPFVVSATSSTTEGRRTPPEHAFDGDRETRWASAHADEQWLEARFDRPVTIETIRIAWEPARAADYSVEVLGEDGSWSEAARRSSSPQLVDEIALAEAPSAVAVRLTCHRRATEWGNSLYEVDMEGRAGGTPPEDNLIGFEVPPTDWERDQREISSRLLAEARSDPPTSSGRSDDEFLDLLERRAFLYFWWETNPTNGLTRDRGRNFRSSEEAESASVAAVGFALSAYVVGVERGWVTRAEALERARITFRSFADGFVMHRHGFFPHFVNYFTGKPDRDTEISTIDTALLVAGMITAMEYFGDSGLVAMGRRIFERIDWPASRGSDPHFVSHGWRQDGAMLSSRWGSTTEGLLIYLLALGSPTWPLPAESWYALNRNLGEAYGYRFVGENGFQSMFRFQYPALWYDFRGKLDRAGVDYFENATRAALAMRAYCIDLAQRFPDSYSPEAWGLSAADGPGNAYMIYGFPPGEPFSPADGSIVPYAIAGSVPFLPQHAIRALRRLYDHHHEAWGKYGLADSINPTLGFTARDMIGIDAGTILLGIENHRSGLIWNLFMRNPWIRRTTQVIGWRQRPLPGDPAGAIDLGRRGDWRFREGGGDLAGPLLDDTTWRRPLVPDHWENLDPSLRDRDGMAWYRVTFGIDGDRLRAWKLTGLPVHLVVGGIDDFDRAYVNGVEVGGTLGGEETFRVRREYPVDPSLLVAGRNVVSFRVVDAGGKGGIWLGPVELGPAF